MSEVTPRDREEKLLAAIADGTTGNLPTPRNRKEKLLKEIYDNGSSGGGGEGTTNYNKLTNKPSINNIPLVGNLRTVDLKLTDKTLTEEGVPAEAKTVGAKLAEQSTSLTALSEQLGNHTVKSDVPENAVFTDTIYDDTEVKESIEELNSNLYTLAYDKNAGWKNLFRNYDSMGRYAFIDETYNGYPVIYSDYQWGGAVQKDIVLKTGKTYTVSAYVKGSGEVGLFYGKLTGTVLRKTLTSDWQRVVWTFTPDTDSANTDSGSGDVRIEQTTGGNTYISCFQIEEGTVATEYEPYIPSVKMLAEEVSAQNESLSNQKKTTFVAGDISWSGVELEDNNWKRCAFIKVTPNATYTIKRSQTQMLNVIGFKNDKTVITDGTVSPNKSSLAVGSGLTEVTFTATATTEYVRIAIKDTNFAENITLSNDGIGQTVVDLVDDVANINSNLGASNAGAHNSIYRGKYLGDDLTTEQKAQISAGTFNDLYIGDYWTIGGVNYRIAAFDYWLNSGDTNCTTHHIVIVPDDNLYTAKMNDTNITTGAYVGSKMYTENLELAKTTITNAFGSENILSHREYLANTTKDTSDPTYESAGSWYDSTVELMNERMVYGEDVFHNIEVNGAIPTNYTIDKSQLPLFALEPSRICNRAYWWLRDVVSVAYFASVSYSGATGNSSASSAFGVRPVFGIKG